jgi:beta-glucosidase
MMRGSRVLVVVVLAPLGAIAVGAAVHGQSRTPKQPELGVRTAKILDVGGLRFRDLNHNGKLDVYEDWRKPVSARADDLVAQMTLEEKAGLMVGPTLPMGPGGTLSEGGQPTANPFGGTVAPLATSDAVTKRHIRQFINRVNTDPRTMAQWLNRVQELAEGTRLGIPAFFVTNPRNHLGGEGRTGIDEAAGAFSQWPGTLGLAATRDAALVEEFGSIAAQEYTSVGLRGAYHPQADLATEPRWGRISGTLGEDADLTSRLITAMVRGFQGPHLGPASVALTVKHFPGGGPAFEGQDSHYVYGKNQAYPGSHFRYHVLPFQAAIKAGVAAMMPYYSIPKGVTKEEVGMAYNREIITDLLRRDLGFQGIVNSDSGITTSMAWGVESLSVEQRYKKAIDAGTDLIGNDSTPEYIVNLVKQGQLAESRIDESARRILRVRFALGIFENPYADPEKAAVTIRKPEFQRRADLAQRKSIVLLKNADALLPLPRGRRIYLDGIDRAVASNLGYMVVDDVAAADVCLVNVVPGRGEGRGRSEGGGRGEGRGRGRGIGGLDTGGEPIVLTLPEAQVARVRAMMREKPTIVSIHLDRPYVIPELARESAGLIATFGVSDAALLDVVSGAFPPTGKLPFELPSSMDAVRAQKEDVPHDSRDPLFAFGAGLTYARSSAQAPR